MTTKVTERLMPDEAGIARAASLLATGGLVAFPTETVYGLGADATNSRAVAAIYEAKGRPRFNPLIVHVCDRAAADRIGVIPEVAEEYLAGGWPAGLTLVVPLRPKSGIASIVTAGGPDVALRVPSAPLARALLERFGGPVAAPSANRSGRVSPTRAVHVLAGLDGRIDAVIEGGAAEAGLESTILGFPDGEPHVYREGIWPAPDKLPRRVSTADAPAAPGQLASHYAPLAQVRLDVAEAGPEEFHIGFGAVAGDVSLSSSGDLAEAAARLFDLLNDADARGLTRLAIAPIPDRGLGRAINDRLRRAAAPRG